MTPEAERSDRPISVLWTGALQRSAVSPNYKWRVLFMLSVVSLFAYMDRYILAVLLGPIKAELGASDTAMGLLVGLAFFAVYAVSAVPLSRLVDHANRRNILVVAVAFWSVATALCGAATNFLQLLLARVGVAVGEAAAAPTNVSLIGDFFPPGQRAIASGGVFAGTAIGIAVGAYVGGLLNDLFGWRVAFVVVGLPGLILASAIWLTVVEPQRGLLDGGLKPEHENLSFVSSVRLLFTIRTYVILLMANAMLYFGVQGPMVWMPTYLMRVHDMSSTAMGLSFGLAMGVGIFAANIIGGVASDRMSRQGGRWYLYTAGAAALVGAPLLFGFAFAPTAGLAITIMPIFAFVTALATPAGGATMLGILPPRHRGLGSAVALFFVNGLGSGVGPLIIGALTDGFAPVFGDEALRYALAFVPLALLGSAGLFLLASRSVERDMKAALFAPASP